MIYLDKAMKSIGFKELIHSQLIVDAVYESSQDGFLEGEPISKLLPGLGNINKGRMQHARIS